MNTKNHDNIAPQLNSQNNSATRLPLFFLIDTTSPISEKYYNELQKILNKFRNTIYENMLNPDKVEVCVKSFSDTTHICQEWCPLIDVSPNKIITICNTNINYSIECAIEKIQKRKTLYRKNGIKLHTPWIIMFSDNPNNDITNISSIINHSLSENRIKLHMININKHNTITNPKIAKDKHFFSPTSNEDFDLIDVLIFLLSTPIHPISQPPPGEMIHIDNFYPSNCDDWLDD